MTKKKRRLKKQFKTKERKFMKKYPWFSYKQFRLDERKRIINPNRKWAEPKKFCAIWDFPKGWYKAFGKLMLEDLDKEIKRSNLKHFTVEQIKEKFGQLRFYNYGGNKKTDEIISAYSIISENVCLHCGEINVPMTYGGWQYPCCKKCWEKNKYHKNVPYESVLDKYDGYDKIPFEYKIRSWHKKDNGEFEEIIKTIDISEYAKKVIEYNKGE